MKIFPSSSIKKLDAYTIEHEPIASIDLMERAATVLTKAITDRWSTDTPVTVFAGPGNNGGDALAIARMMAEKGYKTEVYLFNTKGNLSPDCQTNKELVEMMEEVTFHEISTQFVPPTMGEIALSPIGLSMVNKLRNARDRRNPFTYQATQTVCTQRELRSRTADSRVKRNGGSLRTCRPRMPPFRRRITDRACPDMQL